MEMKEMNSTVKDKKLRVTLIKAAETIMEMLKTGVVNLQTQIPSTSLQGLRVDMTLEQVHEDRPIIFHFQYSLDTQQFIEYLKSHPELTEGVLAFTLKGIQIMVPDGSDKWNKSGFSFNHDNDQKIFIPLLHQSVMFRAHLDLFHGKEWVIDYIEAIAAQDSSNEG